MSDPRLTRRGLLLSTAACGFAAGRCRADPKSPNVEVTLPTGEVVSGDVLRAGEGRIELDERSWPWEEALDATLPGPIPPDGKRGWVELTGGDRLFGDATNFDGDAIRLERADGTTLALPADRVRFVRFADAGPLTKPQRLAALRERGADDLALPRTGGRIGGELLEFDGAAVRLLTAAGETAVPRATVRALALSPELQRPAPPPPRFAVALLADGSHLTAASLTLGPAGGELVTPAGVVVPLAADAVRGLTIVTPAAPLAEAPTESFAPGPAGRAMPRRDRTVVGRRPVANGRPRAPGWGVAAGTTLRFAVPTGATAFVAAFAVDAAAGELAECDALIAVDGEPRWERDGVRAGALHPVRVGLDGAASLSMTVSPGALGGVRDEAFWVAPRFVLTRNP